MACGFSRIIAQQYWCVCFSITVSYRVLNISDDDETVKCVTKKLGFVENWQCRKNLAASRGAGQLCVLASLGWGWGSNLSSGIHPEYDRWRRREAVEGRPRHLVPGGWEAVGNRPPVVDLWSKLVSYDRQRHRRYGDTIAGGCAVRNGAIIHSAVLERLQDPV